MVGYNKSIFIYLSSNYYKTEYREPGKQFQKAYTIDL